MAASLVEQAAMMSTERVHTDPVWRGRANFIIGVLVEGAGAEAVSEQLWARRLSEYSFEICCIPFYKYDLALGDVVEADASFNVSRVLRRSGRLVYRVAAVQDPSMLDDVIPELLRRGGLVERSSPGLVAVDAETKEVAERIVELLDELEAAGLLEYESGQS